MESHKCIGLYKLKVSLERIMNYEIVRRVDLWDSYSGLGDLQFHNNPPCFVWLFKTMWMDDLKVWLTRAEEMAYWVKCLAHKYKNPHLAPRTHIKLNVTICFWNPSDSMVGWEAEVGETLNSVNWVTCHIGKQIQSESQITWKLKT